MLVVGSGSDSDDWNRRGPAVGYDARPSDRYASGATVLYVVRRSRREVGRRAPRLREVQLGQLQSELLGGFRVSVRDRPVPDMTWHWRNPASLVKLLALAPAHRLHREEIVDAPWPVKAAHHCVRFQGPRLTSTPRKVTLRNQGNPAGIPS